MVHLFSGSWPLISSCMYIVVIMHYRHMTKTLLSNDERTLSDSGAENDNEDIFGVREYFIAILVLSLCAFGQPTEVWSRNYGGQSSDPGGAVKSTYDGGYILTGTTYSYGLGRGDLWLVKTDSNGTEQWNKTFGGRNFDIGRSVQQTSDEGYIIAGSTQSFGVRNSDAWLIKTDKNGTEQWNRTFGGRSTDEATSV